MLYHPKKQPKKAALISVLLYAGAAVLFIISGFFAPRLAYQLGALVFISIGIFITSRYILTDYKYVIKDIERTGDEVKFSIIKVNGSREAVMANFDLLSAYALEKCKKISQFEKKHGKVNKFYGYTSNFSSPDTYMLAIEFNGLKVLFGIELSKDFAYELKSRLVNAQGGDTSSGKELI